MKNCFTYLLFLSTITIFAQTQSLKHTSVLEATTPEKVGLSVERVARIDAMCQKAIADNEVPGIVALVARKGKIIFHRAYGMSDNQANRQMKKDDIFRIASQSKAITATAVMMLWEEGLFRLDDPISKYIPAFKNPQILKTFQYSDTSFTTEAAKNEITIRHLLTHTSGLGYGIIDADERFNMIYKKAGITDLFTTKAITIKESVLKLAALPLHHPPGEAYLYCEGLDVLGYFVEIMSGMPFDKFLRERLLDPLGMDDTWFYLPEAKSNRLVTIQQPQQETWIPLPFTFYDPDYPRKGAKTFFSGGAGLSSTAKDYATFLQMYLNGGTLNGVRILSRTTVQMMMHNQIDDLWNGLGRYYGLAFGLVNEIGEAQGGQGSAGTFDWGGYFNTLYFADPQEQLIGVLMKQTWGTNGDNTGWRFRLLVGQTVDD